MREPKHGRKAKRTQRGYRSPSAFDLLMARISDRIRRRIANAPAEPGVPWRVTRDGW